MTANGTHVPLVEGTDLRVAFEDSRRLLRRGTASPGITAVDDVSLAVRRGEIVGLVGESGAGKTTLAKTLVRLLTPVAGTVTFDGEDITHVSGSKLLVLRRRMQMVFQEAHASLSPRLSVAEAVAEPYRIHRIPKREQRPIAELLAAVELAGDIAHRYPHEISGGQARRVGIARALALQPALVVADEPMAGLDVSAAASVLNLLLSLREEFGLAYLVVTHDLDTVGYLADRIAVMYLGQIVETGPALEVLEARRHPYTRLLLSSRPELGVPRVKQRERGTGEMPSPRRPPSGCRFHTRCTFATEVCSTTPPPPETVAEGHTVACHHWRRIQA